MYIAITHETNLAQSKDQLPSEDEPMTDMRQALCVIRLSYMRPVSTANLSDINTYHRKKHLVVGTYSHQKQTY
jgi:hypothetical protein